MQIERTQLPPLKPSAEHVSEHVEFSTRQVKVDKDQTGNRNHQQGEQKSSEDEPEVVEEEVIEKTTIEVLGATQVVATPTPPTTPKVDIRV